ncbi:proline--tRNA ligase [Mesoplasma lactucae]|uniref:Proline--tRNA ligase n=1 Tax=Mesoplasma lactucae ATCC 49193 TaxID=81460 RepID=A0A291IS76_9MOLU|nr:proline--tRNA ligase [Mesoplasma lactucae]ATG97588.1 proline--tRNA ligase [Mesoplasma lactucae ATCC 49193]ATZ19953.1 prolyl-tRNA synthetase [Mesoplasma lactucae ATCC 49193]MCL8217096.1 Proline--tRNA ligase [Mesoplasma lactucae ATCC 49193]
MANNKLNRMTSRDDDFSKWYTDVVTQANLIEYGPVKGTMIFKPYGFGIWELIMQNLDKEFKKLDVENVYLPLLIPASLFQKEKDHIEGFAPEVLTVTKVGDKQLDEDLYIRPTSEVLFSQYFKNNIQSYRDLPIKNNQWVNVMRWEKNTRPFLRTSEFLWQEGHTMHSTPQEAQEFARTMLDVYTKFANEYLLLPVVPGIKTEKERFNGAKETYTIESLMYDGQALQSGTSHYLGDNFSKVYDINFQNKESGVEHPYGTSWGVTTRLIGALIMTHSDDQGLVLPSKVAPTQVQIIQIKNDDEQIVEVSKKLKQDLMDTFRVKIDDSDKSFGFKISEAEIKGIPLRIEVGPRDLQNGVVTISARDNQEKTQVKLDEVVDFVTKEITNYDERLFTRAKNNLATHTFEAKTIDEYEKGINTKPGLYLVPFCGRVECEEEVKKRTSTNSRCIPFEYDHSEEPCFNCGMKTTIKAYFGRAY